MNDPLEVAFRFFQRGVGKFTNYYPGSKVVRNTLARANKFERTLEQTEYPADQKVCFQKVCFIWLHRKQPSSNLSTPLPILPVLASPSI